ncbi:MAG: tRNA lysidine(34) synthetase TilS [Flavobacteriales bacterium]|nr:tRNA lysidine(34) synthetase TilS [Flavobacteriales bacterium]
MLDDVRLTVRRHRLLPENAAVLVAVSGGLDSMVLLHALRKLWYRCEVVHIDHGLRGAESDADRRFVEEHCREQDILCHVRAVDVQALASQQGLSVQMAARELRYEALKKVALATGIEHIALAHHRDDAIETFFLELMRGGTGTIPARSGPFVRPLIGVGRAAIEAYAKEQGLTWREDASNADPKYLRNRVRHELLPLLEDLAPGVRKVLGRSIDRSRALQVVAMEMIDAKLSGHREALPLEMIRQQDGPLLLHRWLRPIGFHPEQLEKLLQAIDDERTGAVFTAGSHRAMVDREAVLLSAIPADAPPEHRIDTDLAVPSDAPFSCERCDTASLDLNEGPSTAWLDEASLNFPLVFRPWRQGDRMRPIGLGGSKLISDILIDAKVPRPEKERTLVLVSGDRIVWLAGHRVAEGAQAKPNSASVLRVALRKA